VLSTHVVGFATVSVSVSLCQSEQERDFEEHEGTIGKAGEKGDHASPGRHPMARGVDFFPILIFLINI
jgi:hypothetical protein